MAEFKFREIEKTQVNDSQNVKSSGFSFKEIEDTTDYTKLKANEIFSIDGSNTDAPNKLNKVNKSWMQKFYDSDIAKFGERDFFSVVHTITAIPSDMKSQLWDMGLDWMEVDDYELFMMLVQTLAPERTSILFGDLDFSKLS